MTSDTLAAPPVPPRAARARDNATRLKFASTEGFQAELRRRVEAALRDQGLRAQDSPRMYVKTAIVLLSFAACYIALVFFAQTWWQAAPLAALLGLCTAAIGFNIQHDGGHHAGSRHPLVNKGMALTLDIIGASSYLWNWKHNLFHHTYVNITGHDEDIEIGIFGRLSPHQKRLPFHRWQHIYLWPLYGLMTIRWHFSDDFRDVIRGKIGEHPIPRPKGWDLFWFITGKVIFFSLALVLPMFFHAWWKVVLGYVIASSVLGVVMSVVFQLAHCVEEADFPMPSEVSGRMENDWAIHQVETTVDFARDSKLAAWLLGGLNFQIEHHLFPRICHVNYPAITRVVEETCRDFGITFHEHRTVWAGLVSHYRWLREMGRPAPAA